ncbi:DUF6185 family protein [Streptomyces sp. AC550_RSS872]|uniref:DUF6185 family protein n=1 Tax=Streptomyces sp. AC550_RSS872 TaxID=2823689 RepID=UPI001C2676ED|nr:DUF6185 family protein [Streptomyces sp. AC550_RSS872]
MVTTALLCMMPAAHARAADDECRTEQLKTARVTASVRLKHEGEDYSKAEGRLTVKVPKSWALAADLLRNGDTERYRTAMRCLLRDPDDTLQYRDTEGRTEPPKVTVGETWMTVDQRVVTWVVSLQDRDFGTWRLSSGNRLWRLELVRPPSLDSAWWQSVSVDLGGRAARSLSAAPTTGSTTELTWTREKAGGKPPEVRLTLQPPAAKASAARWSEDPWYVFDPLAWLVQFDGMLLVLLLLVVRTVRRAPAPSPGTLPGSATDAEVRTVRNLLVMSWLAFALTLANYFDDALLGHFAHHETALFWTDEHRTAVHFGLTLLAGLALCVFGRPGWTAVAFVVAATACTAVVACRPDLFSLPSEWWLDWEEHPEDVRSFRDGQAMYAFAAACACLVLVWLVGTTASLLRLWRSHAAPAPGSSRGRFPHTVLGALVLVSAAIPALSVWTAQNLWEHQSWLSRRQGNEDYGLRHVAALFDEVRWFPSDWLDWVHGGHFWWWAPSLAIVAVLRARDRATVETAVPVPPAELRILKVFFVACVTPVVGWYAGVSLPLLPLLALWLALTGLLLLGTRRAVLYRKLSPSHRLHEVAERSDRQRLLRAARRHRELHARLRRLEQGQQDDDRSDLEHRLDRLHRLRHPSPPPGLPNTWIRLPPSIGPVELALAWGPRATTWGNACRAAYFTALISLPAVALMIWADHVRGIRWADKFVQRLGFVDTVTSALSLELIWVGAGFTLGALWRVLPGRRGPARAFGLALVYVTPVLVQLIGNRIVGQPFGTWPLHLSLTLLVLTLTGVAMDIDTFRGEKHYWPTKMGLLLSVYQWRTASIQVAFLVGQIVALVTIWQQLKGNDPMVFIERSPSETAGGGSSGGQS